MTDGHYNEAEELAKRLDAVLPPASSELPAETTEDEDALVQIAEALSATAPAPLSLDAMARIQSRMLAAQQTSLNAVHPAHPAKKGGLRILRISQSLLAAAASVVLVFFFVSPLIAETIPGDFLYPAKRGIESIELGLASVVRDDAAIHLTRANRRAEELLQLAEADRFQTDLVRSVVDEMSAATDHLRQSGQTPPPALLADAEQVNTLLNYSINRAASASLAAPEELGEVLVLVGVARGSGAMSLGLEADQQIVLEDTPGIPAAAPQPTETPRASTEAEATPEPTLAVITPDEDLTPEPEATDDGVVVVNVPQPETTPSAIIATIVGDGRVNVRRAPGLDAEIMTSLRPGALVQIIDSSEDGEWRRVRLPDSTEGWVANILLVVGQVGITDPITGNDSGSNASDTVEAGDNGDQGDFGCDQPGNACNAPGQTTGSSQNQGRRP